MKQEGEPGAGVAVKRLQTFTGELRAEPINLTQPMTELVIGLR